MQQCSAPHVQRTAQCTRQAQEQTSGLTMAETVVGGAGPQQARSGVSKLVHEKVARRVKQPGGWPNHTSRVYSCHSRTSKMRAQVGVAAWGRTWDTLHAWVLTVGSHCASYLSRYVFVCRHACIFSPFGVMCLASVPGQLSGSQPCLAVMPCLTAGRLSLVWRVAGSFYGWWGKAVLGQRSGARRLLAWRSVNFRFTPAGFPSPCACWRPCAYVGIVGLWSSSE